MIITALGPIGPKIGFRRGASVLFFFFFFLFSSSPSTPTFLFFFPFDCLYYPSVCLDPSPIPFSVR